MSKFQCKRCGQFFSQKVSLIYHLKNVNCNPVLANINVKEFLEQVEKPNYYKLYVKPKAKLNVSDVTERLALLEQRVIELSKRCQIHPLDVGEVRSAKSMLDSLIIKPTLQTGVEYAMEVFENTFKILRSPFYKPRDCDFIHVLYNKTIQAWNKSWFSKFMRLCIFPKLKEGSPAFSRWVEKKDDDYNDRIRNSDVMWEKALRALTSNNLKQYRKKIFEDNNVYKECPWGAFDSDDEEETVNND
jgi:hypothetical protein